MSPVPCFSRILGEIEDDPGCVFKLGEYHYSTKRVFATIVLNLIETIRAITPRKERAG